MCRASHRYQTGLTVIASKFAVGVRYAVIYGPTFADAILDRLIHIAHRHPLDGPSLRKAPDAATV